MTLVRRLAEAKARSVGGDPVLAADTVVDVDGKILGKPGDADDARRMLQRLSGRTHLVHTGVAVRSGDDVEIEVVTTSVRFTPLTPEAIEWYLATGEPFDKAGAYAIQGAGGAFVEEIQGSVSNVIGLPLTTVVRLARTPGHPSVCVRVRPCAQTLGCVANTRMRGSRRVSTLIARLLTPPAGAYDWHSHRPSANR